MLSGYPFQGKGKTSMKHKVMRITTFVLVVFGALTTLAGGIGILTGGIAIPLDWLQGSPFVDYSVPGLALAIIVGGSMLPLAPGVRRPCWLGPPWR
jgi:hypothetical protein